MRILLYDVNHLLPQILLYFILIILNIYSFDFL
jgi:hypothetical protein